MYLFIFGCVGSPLLHGLLVVAVRWLLTAVAFLFEEHRLYSAGFSSCGTQAWWLCSMWNLPRSGIEPMSPALAGKFYPREPPGKPLEIMFLKDAHKNLKCSGTQRRSSNLKENYVKLTCWSRRNFKRVRRQLALSLGQRLAAAIWGVCSTMRT